MCEKGFKNLPDIELPIMYVDCKHCNKIYEAYLFEAGENCRFRMIKIDENHFIIHKNGLNKLVESLNS